jgi:hypothetical protein
MLMSSAVRGPGGSAPQDAPAGVRVHKARGRLRARLSPMLRVRLRVRLRARLGLELDREQIG